MTAPDPDSTELMISAVEFSIWHVDRGGLPFVGVIHGNDGYLSSFGVNEVHQTGDPTAHAEIVAMRHALRDLGRRDLAGTQLLATGEPCGLCYHFAFEHGVERISVAIDADIVADWGFDYRHSYRRFSIDRHALRDDGRIQQLPVSRGLEPFVLFEKHYPRQQAATASVRTSTTERENS